MSLLALIFLVFPYFCLLQVSLFRCGIIRYIRSIFELFSFLIISDFFFDFTHPVNEHIFYSFSYPFYFCDAHSFYFCTLFLETYLFCLPASVSNFFMQCPIFRIEYLLICVQIPISATLWKRHYLRPHGFSRLPFTFNSSDQRQFPLKWKLCDNKNYLRASLWSTDE